MTILSLCILMGILWFSHCLGTNRTVVHRTPLGPDTPVSCRLLSDRPGPSPREADTARCPPGANTSLSGEFLF